MDHKAIAITAFQGWNPVQCNATGKLGFYSLSFTELSHLAYDRILMHLYRVLEEGGA